MTDNNAVEIIKKLIGFDTRPHQSNLDLVDYVVEYFKSHGIKAETQMDPEGRRANVIATIGDPDVPGVILSGHTDVVDVEGQEWSSDPFKAEIRDDKLYGRGSCDMKGQVGCSLAAVPYFINAKIKTPVHYMLSYDEETTSQGVLAMIRDIMPRWPKPKAAIIMEASNLDLVVAHKGVNFFDVIVEGVTVHSSRTELGENAIVVASKIISFLEDLHQQYKKAGGYDMFEPPYPTISTGLMNGGVARNTIPDRCEFSWQVRPIEERHRDETMNALEKFLKEEIYPAYPNAKVNWKEYDLAALEPREKNAARDLAASVLPNAVETTFSGGTEAGFFQRAGVDSIVCGPSTLAMAHCANEYMEMSAIPQADEFFKNLAAKLAE